MREIRIISIWEHSGWGNTIYWRDWENRKICGHLASPPEKGDILRSKMTSGKTARFRFEFVEIMLDPPDQFFATVSDLGYEL